MMDLFDTKLAPMLLTETAKPFDDENYIFEMKFDGTRTLIYADPTGVKIINKRGFILNDTYPELLEIQKLVKDKCIFDGEIILVQDGKPSFKKLQERALLKDKVKIQYMRDNYPVTFVCFDILYDKKNLMNLSLMQRKEILNKYRNTDFFVKAIFVEEKGKLLYKEIEKLGLEGIVAKVKTSEYYPGIRSKEWIKIKNWEDEDFIIYGYNEESANVSSLVLGDESGNYIAKVIIGKKNPEYKIIKSLNTVKKSSLKNFDESKFIYVVPKLKCTIEFLEKTNKGHLRQPIFKGLKLD